jgi:glycosyltransferase involved in cell wall biosynthesis
MTREQPHTPVSVVVPAHNEARVIDRCLRSMHAGSQAGELETVVVCNGCSDETAKVARGSVPGVRVVELEQASKSDALNVGDAVATRFPRFYVDADVEIAIDAIRATTAVLSSPRVLCAAPRPKFELAGRPWLVRAFYETWNCLPYLNDEVVGTGVYALSEQGRARFGEFPAITADDQFVLQQFTAEERASVAAFAFSVFTPPSVAGLLRMRRRAYRGVRELRRYGTPHEVRPTSTADLFVLARNPRRLPGVAVYVATILLARATVLMTPRARAWERDDSGRDAVRTNS